MKAGIFRIGYGAAIALAVVYAFFMLRGPHGIPSLLEKRQEIHQLEGDNAALARENELKKERIERLLTSAPEQELEIRKRLKLVKPNEKVYILKP
jgi:cell division protein FtsB